MIWRVMAIYISAFLIGGLGLYVASRKQPQPVRRERLIKFVTYFCIVNVMLIGAFARHWVFSGLVVLIAVLGARELYTALTRTAGSGFPPAITIALGYLVVTMAATLFAWFSTPAMAVFVYLIVCVFDGFSQVSGQLLGKHRLAPSISPGKTIEGSAGGLFFAIGMALLLRPVTNLSVLQSLVVCCFVVSAAFTGDLLASSIKRWSHVKDFGNLLPGHGGILDRFDSFLFAAAACAAIGLIGQWFAAKFH
jgi:phosphatidate cytidylyltransferase